MSESAFQPGTSVVVARVRGPHGRDGGLRVELLSDLPGRFDIGGELFVDGVSRKISYARQTGPSLALLWLEGISTRGQADALSGTFLEASPTDDFPLEEGEFFHYQLIGLQVKTGAGEALGTLEEILETGSNDVYIVRGPQGEILIPALASVVKDVDIGSGTMLVELPDGLR